MELKNGYKIIYESRNIASEVLTRHLKATKTIPATSDVALTYKDASGVIIEIETINAFKLVYEVAGNLYGSLDGKVNKNASGEITDTMINVYSGNDLLIGTEPVVVVKTTKSSKKVAKE